MIVSMENRKTIPITLEEMTDEQRAVIQDCKADINLLLPLSLRRAIKHSNIYIDFDFEIKSCVASNGGDIMYFHTYNYKVEFKHNRVKADKPCIANYHIVATPSDDDYLKDEVRHIKQDVVIGKGGQWYGRKIKSVFRNIYDWMQGQGHADIAKVVTECTRRIVEGNNN